MRIQLPKKYNGIAEQLIRPTGLLDPIVYLRPSEQDKKEELYKSLRSNSFDEIAEELNTSDVLNQIDDLLKQIQTVVEKGQRALVTTLTKRMSEDLTSYLKELNIKVQYLHSEVETVERVEILRDLRLGKYDVVVGINLLREGIDLPEVSLVAILDADKEGFLRSEVALIQVMGRAARHEEGKVIMYADHITGSMYRAIKETLRRRRIQENYNNKHGITPKTIRKEIKDQLKRSEIKQDKREKLPDSLEKRIEIYPTFTKKQKRDLLNELEVQMLMYADQLEFEKAAKLRDLIDKLKERRKTSTKK